MTANARQTIIRSVMRVKVGALCARTFTRATLTHDVCQTTACSSETFGLKKPRMRFGHFKALSRDEVLSLNISKHVPDILHEWFL